MNRRRLLLGTVLLSAGLALSSPALSEGFEGPYQGISNVKEAIDASRSQDDAPVKLTGRLVSALGKGQYLFADESGQIEVKIDKKRWRGQTVTPENTIELTGSLDVDFMQDNEIHVDSIRVVK